MNDKIVQLREIDEMGVEQGNNFPITLTTAVYDPTNKERLDDTLTKKASVAQLNSVKSIAESKTDMAAVEGKLAEYNPTTNFKTVGGASIIGVGDIPAGGSITVDSELSSTSMNPVENRVITRALNSAAYKDYIQYQLEESSPGNGDIQLRPEIGKNYIFLLPQTLPAEYDSYINIQNIGGGYDAIIDTTGVQFANLYVSGIEGTVVYGVSEFLHDHAYYLSYRGGTCYIVDLIGMTDTQVQDIINQNTAGFATNTRVNEVALLIPTDTVNTEQLREVQTLAESKTDMSSVQTYITEQDFATKSELPTVPTKTSELTNDSDFTTLSAVQNAGYGKIIPDEVIVIPTPLPESRDITVDITGKSNKFIVIRPDYGVSEMPKVHRIIVSSSERVTNVCVCISGFGAFSTQHPGKYEVHISWNLQMLCIGNSDNKFYIKDTDDILNGFYKDSSIGWLVTGDLTDNYDAVSAHTVKTQIDRIDNSLNTKTTLTEVSQQGYQTSAQVESAITGKDYATNTRVDEVEGKIPTDTVTTSQLNAVNETATTAQNNVENVVSRVDTIDQEMLNKAEKSELPTKTSELTNDSGFAKMWFGTQSEYDAIVTKEPTTVYNITES